MSWDVVMRLCFAEGMDPVERFVRLAERIHQNPHYGAVVALRVRQSRSQPEELELLDLVLGGSVENPTPVPYDQIWELRERFHGEDLSVEGWWEVPRYEIDPQLGLTSFSYSAVVQCIGLAYARFRDEHRGKMYYSANDYHLYAPCDPIEAPRENITALIEEVRFLAELHPETIDGLDRNNGYAPDGRVNPLQNLLVYRRDPADYHSIMLAALKEPRPLRAVTVDDVRQAALLCEEIALEEADEGPIVYHRDLADGNLYPFYEKLLEIVEVR